MDDKSIEPPPRIKLHLLFLMLVGAAVLGLVYRVTEWIIFEKVLTALAMPIGMLWMLLIMSIYFSMVYKARLLKWFSAIAFLILTISASPFTADLMSSSLERPYWDFSPDECEEFEAVVILGGGTSYAVNNRPQFNGSGDRIGLAARLYNLGKTKLIISTGRPLDGAETAGIPSLGDQTETLLVGLGVPKESIAKIGGRNTREEMVELDRYIRNFEIDVEKVGLVTSAWHMPRALRLAKRNGLELRPVPADFRSEKGFFSVLNLLPNTGSLNTVTQLSKEYLAWAVGK